MARSFISLVKFSFRLSEDLVLFILRLAVKESSQLIRQCVTADRMEFDRILASVPVSLSFEDCLILQYR